MNVVISPELNPFIFFATLATPLASGAALVDQAREAGYCLGSCFGTVRVFASLQDFIFL